LKGILGGDVSKRFSGFKLFDNLLINLGVLFRIYTFNSKHFFDGEFIRVL
jgi:hypothetical protein